MSPFVGVIVLITFLLVLALLWFFTRFMVPVEALIAGAATVVGTAHLCAGLVYELPLLLGAAAVQLIAAAVFGARAGAQMSGKPLVRRPPRDRFTA
ncbi:MAG: hypothetical protein Q8L48_15685 [Archangium sp.]|nr:hypothetical protein [Archangium sp.]